MMMEHLQSWSASEDGQKASGHHRAMTEALNDMRRAVKRYCEEAEAYTALHPDAEDDTEQELGILVAALMTVWAQAHPEDWEIQVEMTEEADAG